MKKTVYVFVLCVLALLSSCGETVKEKQVKAEDVSNNIVEEVQSSTPEECISIPFSTVDEMLGAFGAADQGQTAMSTTETNSNNIAVIQAVANKSISNNELIVPVYNESSLPLRNVANRDNILVDSTSVYGMPLIWYYSELEGADVIITTGILPEQQIQQIGNGGIVALKELHEELLSELPANPNAADVSVTIREEELSIGDEMLLAVITQYSTDSRCHVEFLVNNLMYVRIYVYPDDLERGVLEKLTFEAMQFQ